MFTRRRQAKKLEQVARMLQAVDAAAKRPTPPPRARVSLRAAS
jgi:hypothetical protein